MGKRSQKSVRVSISLPATDYEELRTIADNDDVSVAWVVRRAVSSFLSTQAPLFSGGSAKTNTRRRRTDDANG